MSEEPFSTTQKQSAVVELAQTKPALRNLVRNRLTTKYLWWSLLVALIPLLGFASLYDSYFSSLVTRITQEQLATRMAATQNEFRVFIRERTYELEALADQLDNPQFYQLNGREYLSPELESLLRLQVDASSVYAVAFFSESGELAWTFPEAQSIATTQNSFPFEDLELIGPTDYTTNRPASVVLRKTKFNSQQGKGSIGLVLRFNSLTEIMRNLDHSSTYRVLLQIAQGKAYDVVGQPVNINHKSTQQVALLAGWSLHVIQDQQWVISPAERMRYWLIFLMVCTIGGLFWLHMSISRRLNRQVETLIESVEQVAQGNLETPVTHVKGIEMRRLTLAIERMRLQLKSFIRSTLDIERRATLGQLSAGLAHDIRNPLTTIRTTVDALARREKDPENKEMMGIVEEEIDRVNEVLENLLNFARPREPQASAIDGLDLLNSIAVLVGASARNQGVSISVNRTVDNIGQEQGKLVLWADEGHLRQVLMNLVLNALEAMSLTGSHIELQVWRVKREIALQVKDNGHGMSAQTQAHILEPFYTTKAAGTGLGLAICGTLIESNGGRMDIQSQINIGTTVTVFMPMSVNRKGKL